MLIGGKLIVQRSSRIKRANVNQYRLRWLPVAITILKG